MSTPTPMTLSADLLALLNAAERRHLAAVLEEADRPQLVWLLPESTFAVTDDEARRVVTLLMSGLAQVGTVVMLLPWREGLAAGCRILPTERGHAVLERWHHDVVEAMGRTVADVATGITEALTAEGGR